MIRHVLGLIPARGGSKGIPRKNIRLLAERPLLTYTAEAALRAKSLQRVILSTDDKEIAAIASQSGVGVPFLRPVEYARDESSSIAVIHHALDWLSMNEGYRPTAVALLSPTCPFRGAAEIDAAIELLWKSGLDSAVTISSVQDHPYFVLERKREGRLHFLVDAPDRPLRRQDQHTFFIESQGVLVSRTEYLLRCGDSEPVVNWDSVAGFEVGRETALDIDTPMDLEIAEILIRRGHVL